MSDFGSEDDGSGSIASAFQSQSSLGSSMKHSFDSESEAHDDLGGYGEEDLDEVDPEFKRQFDIAKAEFNDLKNQSYLIQKKLIELFPALGFEDPSSSSAGVSDYERRYQDALDRLDVVRTELEQTRQHYGSELQSLQTHCAESDARKGEKEDEFHKLREAAGKGSVMSRTNKPIKQTDLNSKENQLSGKEFELEQTRIDFIRTKNKHKQTEDELNKQDQLSEGLHLIDFEQLKIENQTLNEKKAEKNQDLVKIEDKIRVNAHMLTHVKEKLAFVRKQKLGLQQNQQDMDEAYAQSRAKLATARIKRDNIRDENSALKKSSGLIGMTDLLYDFENRSNELELMQDRVTELKTRFNDLTAMQHELEAKIAQRQPLDPTLAKMNRKRQIVLCQLQIRSKDLSFSRANYKLGLAVQSFLVGLFCVVAFFSEIMALSGHLNFVLAEVLSFTVNEISCVMPHLLVGLLALGFSGGAAMYRAIMEGFFAAMFYFAATADVCTTVEINDDNSISERQISLIEMSKQQR